MNRLRQDFLNQTLLKLENLIADLRGEAAKDFSETFRREAFRTLHTIKGTALTVGFAASGKLAHELENLLVAANVRPKNDSAENYKTLLLEGLLNLKKTFESADYEIPAAFLKKIDARISRENKPETDFTAIPERIFTQLTVSEKSALAASLHNEKRIFCLEINFASASFAEDFAAFRQTLCEKCEIIATLPATANDGEIGFQILIATADDDIDETIVETSAEIVFRFSARGESSSRLENIFAQAAAHGETCALDLGKSVRFEIDCEENGEVPAAITNVIFDALNHLIRNAIDHAIESPDERRALNKAARGTIKIDFAAAGNEFRLRVEDDGRGIDAEKIKAVAAAKNLISCGGDLTETETLALIFLPEFSTRDAVTEISGRGVGLDAVKTAIEKANGRIAVESEAGKGTTLEIFLPRDNFE